MKYLFFCFLLSVLVGCSSGGSFASKSKDGNLEINVITQDAAARVAYCDVYVDGQFVGNVSAKRPVLNLAEGEREIKVYLAGYKPYVRTIVIVGQPNHQVLNVELVK